jgi:hypothetical protein
MTLVIKNGLPPAMQWQGNSAVFDGTEELAERYALYFRINPTFANAVVRNPGCLPGTQSKLYAEILLLNGIGIKDALDAFVSISPCQTVAGGGNGSLAAHYSDFIMASDVTEQSIRSVVSKAFSALEAKVNGEPRMAAALGLTLKP